MRQRELTEVRRRAQAKPFHQSPGPRGGARTEEVPVKQKRYDGYRSFQYLEEGVDYRPYKLVPEINRVEPYTVEVTEEQEERVQRMLHDNVVISLHEHPMVMPEDLDQVFNYIRDNHIHTGYAGLAVSGLDAVFDNLLDGTASITSKPRLEVGRHHLRPGHAAVRPRPPGLRHPGHHASTTSGAPKRDGQVAFIAVARGRHA